MAAEPTKSIISFHTLSTHNSCIFTTVCYASTCFAWPNTTAPQTPLWTVVGSLPLTYKVAHEPQEDRI